MYPPPQAVGPNVYRGPVPQDQSPPQTGAAYTHQSGLIQQQVPYPIPPPSVSSVSQPPPRGIYTPTASMATPQPMIQPTYMATPIMTYQAPPPAGPPAGAYPIQGHINPTMPPNMAPTMAPIQAYAPNPQVSGPLHFFFFSPTKIFFPIISISININC